MRDGRHWGHWVAVIAVIGAATSALSAGERGMVAILGGGQENPPADTSGQGCARLSVDTEANIVRYHIAYCGLSGPATAAHFHGAAGIGQNAGVVHNFGDPSSPIVGQWNYPENMEATILGGRIYINVHTATFPGGEIRGQVVDMVAKIDGFQENPPTGSSGTGWGLFMLDTFNDQLDYHIVIESLEGVETDAHVHGLALHTENADPLLILPKGSPKIGSFEYDAVIEDAILNGRIYTNIHSDKNPGGEIRGQITRFVAPLDNEQEVPANDSEGCGCGFVAEEKDAVTLSYYLGYDELTGPSTAAHIHGFAPPGVNAGVRHGIGTSNPAKGAWTFGEVDADNVHAGLTYFNVHTAAFPGGEIRGQIIFPAKPCPTDIDCSGATDFNDLLEVLSNWGPYKPCPPHAPQDLDRDCDIGFSDLLQVLAAWGECP